MKNENRHTEVLTFRKDGHLATAVTDGHNHRTYEFEKVTDHRSLARAISYLAAHGYQIDTEAFNGI